MLQGADSSYFPTQWEQNKSVWSGDEMQSIVGDETSPDLGSLSSDTGAKPGNKGA